MAQRFVRRVGPDLSSDETLTQAEGRVDTRRFAVGSAAPSWRHRFVCLRLFRRGLFLLVGMGSSRDAFAQSIEIIRCIVPEVVLAKLEFCRRVAIGQLADGGAQSSHRPSEPVRELDKVPHECRQDRD